MGGSLFCWPAAPPWSEFIANEIHRRARVPGPPYDVILMARRLGYRVRFVPSLAGPVGLLIGTTICVVRSAPLETIAMTVGHELAHAVARELGMPAQPEGAVEYTMDAAAAAILMPRVDILRLLRDSKKTSSILAIFTPMPQPWAAIRLNRIYRQ